ncbi:MAG: hypothetical protein C0483_22340 [Pirellula sp.]|nr:hypothetical protein [Pirellula sp.]
MKAFITGINGFIGSHLAEYLRAVGDDVLGSVRGGETLRHAPPGVEAVAWDLASPTSDAHVRKAVTQFAPDVVYHLAALSISADCGADEPTAAAQAVNVEGVRRVLELAGSLPRPPRVVFASTSRVYAPVEPSSPVVNEQSPCDPQSAYGKTKLAAEAICRRAQEASGQDVVIARLFPQAGSRQDPRLMLAEWARQLTGTEPVIRVGNLHVTVDLLDVRDGVRALRDVASHGASGAIYNIGSGSPCTTGELFELLRRTAGDRRPWQERELIPRSDPIADLTALAACSDWTPTISRAETVAEVWTYWHNRDRSGASPPRPQQQQQQQQ